MVYAAKIFSHGEEVYYAKIVLVFAVILLEFYGNLQEFD